MNKLYEVVGAMEESGGVHQHEISIGCLAADYVIEAVFHVEKAAFIQHGVERAPGDQHGLISRSGRCAESGSVGHQQSLHLMACQRIQEARQVAVESEHVRLRDPL